MSVKRWRRSIAAAYCAVVLAFLVGYYVSVRGARLDTSVDWTNPLLVLGLLSLLVGMAFGRWHVLVLPLAAVPVTLSLFALASVDDRYRRAAPTSGAPISAGDWAGYAAVTIAITVPALATGIFLVAIGRRLDARSRTGRG